MAVEKKSRKRTREEGCWQETQGVNQSMRQGCKIEFGGLVIQSEEVPLDLVANREALKKHLFKSFFKNDFALQTVGCYSSFTICS